ncbi:aromatic acid exporter family protein [Streptomyces sp. NPDC006464]|uniref:aromatic acid exporter family protein n=1 Tax=unclassified Streptomyces TaxID=2593676 RepID=UPI0033A43578
MLLGAKTVVAAMVAWVLARYLLPPSVSTFAPFTALVALQATVYRSARDCVQYLLAMAAGATLAASLAASAGIHGWTFGLLTLLALGVGKSRRFGRQSPQVVVIGFFAFSSGAGRIDYIGHLAASVAIGAVCGLTAHLALAPARHTHHRQQAVADLYGALSDRLNALADAFDSGGPERDHVRQWRRDWRRLSEEGERLRRAIDTEIENGYLNPRRSVRGADETLHRARKAVLLAERAMDHLRSMTRTLHHALDSEELGDLPAGFRPRFSSVLRAAASAMAEIGRTSPTEPGRLDARFDGADADLDRAGEQERNASADSPAVHALQGTLLTDASRLLDDLRAGRRDFIATS